MLNEYDRKELLKIARTSIANDFLRKKGDVEAPKSRALNEKRGVFVTLHTKDYRLRGCIGLMQAKMPLYETVNEMALEAAFGDNRFERVRQEELEDLVIEISILTPFRKVTDSKEIVLGIHGVMVKSGCDSGVFLPQVAIETGWNLEELMSHLCADKAGLPPDAWKNGTAEVYTFEAEILSE